MSEGEPADESTGLPVISTWRGVYFVVVAAFVLLVGALVILQRIYS
jgi:hypothetical protein